MPEIVHHNTVYFDLAADLSWQPQPIALSSYLDGYLTRRYGRENAAAMRPAWDELVASVYGEYDFTAPPYQKVPTLKYPDTLAMREKFIPHLKKALEDALACKDKLGDNHLYQVDLIDITRQYLAEVFNVHYRNLVAAFKASDKAKFDAAAAGMRKCLDLQEAILSSDPIYCVQTEIDKALPLPQHSREAWASNLTDNGQVVRQRYTALFGMQNYPTLIDYCGKDMYELVKYYYKARIEAFVADLRASIDAPDKFTADKLAEQCKAITAKFVATPFKDYKATPSPYQGKPVEAAEAVLKAMKSNHSARFEVPDCHLGGAMFKSLVLDPRAAVCHLSDLEGESYMKAAVLREYGKLSVEEVPEIVPGDYDCLVQIVACGICNGTDSKLYHGQFPPHGQPPSIIGHESVGRVIKVGPKVRNFAVGDMVYRPIARYDRPGNTCDLGFAWGGFAERGIITDGRAIVEDNPGTEMEYWWPFHRTYPADIPAEDAIIMITLMETWSWLGAVRREQEDQPDAVGLGPGRPLDGRLRAGDGRAGPDRGRHFRNVAQARGRLRSQECA